MCAYSLMRSFSQDKAFQHKLRGGAINISTGLLRLPVMQDNIYTQKYRDLFKFHPLNLAPADYRYSNEMAAMYFFASLARLTQYSAIWTYCGFAVQYFHAVRRLPVLRGAPYNRDIIPSHNFNFALVFYYLFPLYLQLQSCW